MIKDKSIQNRKEKDCSCAGEALTSLEHTVARLRAPDGCPWDRVQTHESIKAACVEEAAEVLCGINILSETGDPRSLREELGDLLFQVVMHAQMAEEEGLFTLEDVIRGVNEKMLRRHPHVFGEESIRYMPPAYIRHMQEKLTAQETQNMQAVLDNHDIHDMNSLQDPQDMEQENQACKDQMHSKKATAYSPDRPEGSCSARDGVSGSEGTHSLEYPAKAAEEAQESPLVLLADWKEIKKYEKEGREWEEDYLFRAFDEAEELIGVARKRKMEKKY